MTQKTILVTGGAGFIGSHLIERLLADNHHVISLDNYFTGSRDNHISGAEYREGHTKDIAQHVSERVDLVFHLGEYSRVEKSFDDMALVWDLNKNGTFGVLEYCRAHNIKIVYAGSSSKFGDGGMGRDQSPYAWTKASNTELVENYGEWFGLPYAITYFYNVYGPREISTGPYSTVIGIFKEQYKDKKPLTVVSPGTQKRNFTHVKDIIDGLIFVGEKGEGDDFGLGASKKYSILEIAELFNSEITMLPERKGNRMESSIDISKSKQLGWEAKKDVADYIKALL
ncbi:ADP-L-glycero-D-manno-heptose-6-epimerase [bacterium]|nr:ADP-L-glycero-D-manno-heptose-6-epimerase [bacterium]|tara:strand:- start:40208 stop:41059 length:852 start_codon:yes stop_codon:yes gene_type:complete